MSKSEDKKENEELTGKSFPEAPSVIEGKNGVIHATPSQLSGMVYCARQAWMGSRKLTRVSKEMSLGQQKHKEIEKFNRQWVKNIQAYRRIKLRQLNQLLKSARDKIVTDVGKDRQLKRDLQNILKNFSFHILETAESLSKKNQVNTKELTHTFFGGSLQFEYPPREFHYKARADIVGIQELSFVVTEVKTGKTPDAPYEGHVLQAAATAVDLEEFKQLRGLKCTELRIIYPEKRFKFPLTPQLRKKVEFDRGSYAIICKLPRPPPIENSAKCEQCSQKEICFGLEEKFKDSTPQNQIQKHVNQENSSTLSSGNSGGSLPPPNINNCEEKYIQPRYLGKIIQNNKYPFILKQGRENEVWAIIKEDQLSEIKDGDLVIFEDQDLQIKILAETRELKTFPAHAALNWKSTSELVTFARLNPMKEFSEEETLTSPIGRDYTGFQLRKATTEEILVFFSLPRNGIPLGILDNGEESSVTNAIPYYYPLEKNNQIFRGVFITGTPGKGKTNFLKLLLCEIPEYFGGGAPPAIIVLDIEGEYSKLDQPTTGSQFDYEFWERFDVHPVSRFNHFMISKLGLDGDTTLRFEKIDPREISLLFPALPEKSRQIFEQITRYVFKNYQIPTFYEFRAAFREILTRYKETFGVPLHDAQKDALLRGMYTGIEDIFDQNGEYLDIEGLIKPGMVSVIDCSGMTDIRLSRQIALYLFLAIKKYKIDVKNSDLPVLIFFDEAHELFPRTAKNQMEADYLQRVTNQVERILRIGRKRKYGFVFASQMPQDVSSDIVDLCQTKIIMGLENERWITKILGSKWVKKILSLTRGSALIYCPEFHSEPMKIRVPKAPCKHES